jgi:hypothetical protein
MDVDIILIGNTTEVNLLIVSNGKISLLCTKLATLLAHIAK